MKEIQGIFSCARALRVGFHYCNEYGLFNLGMTNPSAYLFGKNGYTLMSPAFLKFTNVNKLMMLCVKSSYVDQFRPGNCDIPLWLCEIGEKGRRRFFARAFQTIFHDEKVTESVKQFIVEKGFYVSELKDFFEKENLTNRLYLIEENEEYLNFSVDDGERINFSEAGFDFSKAKEQGILAGLFYDVRYQGDRSLMEELLEKYLAEVRWIPYDEAERETVYEKVYQELGMYRCPDVNKRDVQYE